MTGAPHPQQVQIFRATAKPEDFKNANVGDWIQGVGEITTEYEKKFIRNFGMALSTTSAEQVLDELLRRLSKEEFHCMEIPYTVVKRVREIIAQLRAGARR